jgi:cytochrome oxidase assembly protein ShyY1
MPRAPLPPPARRASERGQATVELVALLPVIALLGLGGWQIAIAGHTMWEATVAARAAARAHALGDDPEKVIARLLPGGFDDHARVTAKDDGAVAVEVVVPAITGGRLTTFTTTARFEPQ